MASSPVFIQGDAHAYWLCTRVNKCKRRLSTVWQILKFLRE
ncbi:hypothetical protein CSC22_0280 [Escherichia coli]|nr:hypothetical protein CSC22_0280 [Escherichia coli]